MAIVMILGAGCSGKGVSAEGMRNWTGRACGEDGKVQGGLAVCFIALLGW